MVSLPVIGLILSNLLLVYGVIFLGWNFANIIFLYWFENVVIGFFTVFKMILAQNLTVSSSSSQTTRVPVSVVKYFLIAFFILHYGVFTQAHGVFLAVMFGGNITFQSSLLIAIFMMFLSHGISFINNYVRPKDYLRTSPALLMFAPYPRIIVVHLTVLFAGLFIMNNVSVLSLVLFAILKAIVDLGSHLIEHGGENHEGIHPIFERFLVSMFEKSVKSGKWQNTANAMDPKDREKIESFYRSRGVDI